MTHETQLKLIHLECIPFCELICSIQEQQWFLPSLYENHRVAFTHLLLLATEKVQNLFIMHACLQAVAVVQLHSCMSTVHGVPFVFVKSRLTSVITKSTSNAAICSLTISKCLMKNR